MKKTRNVHHQLYYSAKTWIVVCLVGVLIGFGAAYSQVSPILLRTTGGTVGAKTELMLLARSGAVDFSSEVRLQGRLTLSNPTVFYPQQWIVEKSTVPVDSTLTRLNDSTYTFLLRLRCASPQGCDTLIRLRGEVLAASDSVCEVRLTDLRLTDAAGSRIIPPTSAVLTVQSFGTPLPIIRVPRLEQNAPNPVARGNSTTWAYRIDEPSDITFSIYTSLGQEVVRIERKNQARGAHLETWTPETPLSGGIYFVRFSSNTGEIWQRCVIQ